MKKSLMVFLIVFTVPLTSCGYNGIMYKYLTNADNYYSLGVYVKSIYYYLDGNSEKFEDFKNEDILQARDIYISVQIDTSDSQPIVGHTYDFEIIPSNNELLYENGFYDNIEIGEYCNIRASWWIYMDGNFSYLASVIHMEDEYLNFDEGLNNIVELMDQDRSLF